MTHGSLFSGFGGFDLAAERAGWQNAFHCEINPSARLVLKDHFPEAVSYEDIKSTSFTTWRGRIDVLTGGFPCQDASAAGGGQQGLSGARTGLYWHMLGAIEEIQPSFVVAENVSNLLKLNGGTDFFQILNSLHAIGYDAEWRNLYAAHVGAPHLRERVYLVAYARRLGFSPEKHVFPVVVQAANTVARDIAGTTCKVGGAWNSEPPILSLDDGVSRGLGKGIDAVIHGAGNAVVPQLAYQVFQWIEEFRRSVEKS